MWSAGFTLIELMIVITIIALLSIVGYVNFKDFAAAQYTDRAAGQIQSLLRLAQSNATSSTLCNGQGATSWFLNFTSDKVIQLNCNPAGLPRSYTLENARIGQFQCGINSVGFPFTLTYRSGAGALTFSAPCTTSESLTFTIINLKNNTTQNYNISKGGILNEQ